jgi:predicted Fe-Mo cluster-binding NifX family protein
MHVEVQKDFPLDKAHAISEEVEEKIRKRFKDVESITIHMGLSHKEKIKIGIPVLEDRGLESITSTHFGAAPLFAFVEVEKGQAMNAYFKVNEATKLIRKKGMTAAQFLVDEKVDVVMVGGLGEGSFHLLRDNLVQIYFLPESIKVEEVVSLLNQNKLERVTLPIDKHETKDADE